MSTRIFVWCKNILFYFKLNFLRLRFFDQDTTKLILLQIMFGFYGLNKVGISEKYIFTVNTIYSVEVIVL